MSQRIIKLDDIVEGNDLQLISNKTNTVSTLSTDDEYPSAKGVQIALEEYAEPIKGSNDNYVTDTEKAALHSHSNKTALDNVSGTNTGDQDLSDYPTASEVEQLISDYAEPLKSDDDNYVTDAEKIVIGNTSGTNTGDNATNTQYSGLAASKLSLDQSTPQTIINGQPIQNTLTASQIVATDASKKLQSLAVATYPSLAELAYVKGVSSAIQTQMNAKAPIASPTFTGVASAPNFIEGFTTTATAGATTTLTNLSNYLQYFTGALNQTLVLPTTSVVAGFQYMIVNLSTGIITVNSSGGNLVVTLQPNTYAMVTALVATPTTAANWNAQYSSTIGTELLIGLLQLANLTEAAAGIDDTKAMSALKTYASYRLNHLQYTGNLSDLNMETFNVFTAKSMMNASGGFMVKLINKTGANSVKGTVVYASTTTDNAFNVNPTDGDMPFGVVFEDGIADAQECWVVISGIAEVLLVNSVASTRSYIAYSSSTVAGRIDTAASAPASTTHFREIGHTLESKTAGTNVLCKCILHFN